MAETKTENLSESLTINLPNQQNFEIDNPAMADLIIPDYGISFYITRISKAIIVPTDGDSFFIGRSSQESSPALKLNLEDLDGFAMGVSRRHVLIRTVGQGYEVTDLSSRNGTWLDGQRLVPKKSYPMKSGSLLRVGQEKILVRYHSFPS